MIVAGVGAGFVNVPLAATAIGVVEPARAGMASGINTTFRQVGTATGVAVLGAIFASHVRSTVADHLSTTSVGGHAASLAHAIGAGGMSRVLAQVPATARPAVVQAGHAGFVNGLNLVLLVGAVIAFTAAATTFLLVRERDFVASAHGEGADVDAKTSVAPA
jgi:hypothetical protein